MRDKDFISIIFIHYYLHRIFFRIIIVWDTFSSNLIFNSSNSISR